MQDITYQDYPHVSLFMRFAYRSNRDLSIHDMKKANRKTNVLFESRLW